MEPCPQPSSQRRRDRSHAAISLLLCGSLGAPVVAHDFWIEPSTYRPATGQPVALRLRVGEHFLGDVVARNPSLVARFTLHGALGDRPVDGTVGVDPAGFVRPGAGEGALVVAYEGEVTEARLDPAALSRYLAEEGLTALASALRGSPIVVDRFSRHAKSLLRAADGPNDGFDRRLGLTLELTPLRPPEALAGGGSLPVELRFEGRALAATRITALPRLRPREPVRGITDATGIATLDLGPGEWLLKAVVAHDEAGAPDAELRSFWASLTLQLPESTP